MPQSSISKKNDIGYDLTFGVSLWKVYKCTAIWSRGLDEITGEDGNSSHKVATRRKFLYLNQCAEWKYDWEQILTQNASFNVLDMQFGIVTQLNVKTELELGDILIMISFNWSLFI